MLFVRDVEHVADELDVGVLLFERCREPQRDLVRFHIVADVEHVEMRRRYLDECRAVDCLAVNEVWKLKERTIY